ncbi:MAG TPA: hypothetical protein VFO79_05705, partial [Xanthomonadales bacterium]|nr:hypothetical protein [Xanthomonadales bacterium]
QHAGTGAWVYAPTVGHPATSYSLATANLQNATQYHVWIRALDAAGNGGPFGHLGTFTVSIDTAAPGGVPNAVARIGGQNVAGLTVGVTNPTIALSWSHATDNVGVASYQVVLQHAGTGNWLYYPTVAYPATSYSLATANLANGTQYLVWMRALDAAGNAGPFGHLGTFTVVLDTTPPGAPGSFAALLNTRSIGGQQVPWSNPLVDLSWTPASDASGIRQYSVAIERVDVAGTAGSRLVAGTATTLAYATSNLVVGGTYRFSIRAQDNRDNWGPAAQSPTFVIAPPLSSSVNPQLELMITSVQVVDDPERAFGCGPWTFCAMMSSLAGSQDPAAFTERFFRLHDVQQRIGDDVIQPEPHVTSKVLGAWPRLGDGRLDMARSPLKLLAIVNRADLVGPGDAGEARMVFGFEVNEVDDFTLIMEYRMSTALMSRAQWWAEWHRLMQNPDPWSPAYRQQLQFLTDSFARTPINGKISLGQLRTNDGLAFRTTLRWEFREFHQPSANGDLVQTTVKNTPRQIWQDSTALGNWINANEAAVLAETHVLGDPITLGGADFLFGFSTPSNVVNKRAGAQFSKNTCSGCHIQNSLEPNGRAIFYHLTPRKAFQETQQSAFFRSVQLCGETSENFDCLFPYTQNELVRRKGIFEQDLGLVGFGATATSAVPMRNPTDAQVVTLESLNRVH